MTSLCEFIVSGVVTGVSGVYHVIGRCGDIGFRVGDTFDQLEHPDEDTRSVRVKIVAIHAYQHSLEELGSGMTASIDVAGDGVQWLRPNSILVVSNPNRVLNADARESVTNHV